MSQHATPWWKLPKGEAHRTLIDYVQAVEQDQSDLFERFVRLAYLYDPNDPFTRWGRPSNGPNAQVTENVVASNVDSACAAIAATEVRARFLTDDGDWSMQRRARHLDWYAEGLGKMLKLNELAQAAFKDCAIKGTGLIKVFVDDGEIKAERVLADDVIVDEGECRAGGRPRQMHQRVLMDVDELVEKFPEHEIQIRATGKHSLAGGSNGSGSFWADYRPLQDHERVVIESWGYGRHCICIEGLTLLDEDWDHDFFPIAAVKWSERTRGWYGIGLAERIAGHQRVINKLNWQEDKLIDRHAFPTTYVQMADANISVKTRSRVGVVVPYKSQPPVTVIPQSVPSEVKERRMYAKESAYEETGMSRLAATSRKPAGLESGAALREYRDQTTQRFAQQEKGYERFVLHLHWLALQCAKELGADAPVIIRRSKLGPKKIEWGDVDMTEVRVQMSAASTLPRTAAGRTQLFLEAAQAGVISQEEARRVMDAHSPLDLEHDISLFTAALENAEETIESVLDGEVVMPHAFQNLEMLAWRTRNAYLRAEDNGAPENILEALRTLVVNAEWELSQVNQPPEGEAMMATEGQPGVMPSAAQPQAALAPEAMNLMAQ